MKMFVKVALAAALSTGVCSAVIVTPAQAQKNNKNNKNGNNNNNKRNSTPPKPTNTVQIGDTKLKLSPEVIKQARIAEPLIQARDLAGAEPAVAAAEAAATTDNDRYITAAMRLDLETQRMYAASAANGAVNEASLKAPLDSLIGNPVTPATDLPKFLYRRGSIAYNQKAWAESLTYFDKAQAGGYADEHLPLQIVTAKVNSGDVKGGMTELNDIVEKASAGGQKAPEDYYKFAISKLTAAKDRAGTIEWMGKWVSAYPTSKNWMQILYIYGLQNNSLTKLDAGQTVDMFRLLRQTHALADEYSYLDYARKLIDAGLPEEAKAVVAEGRATGKVPSTGPSVQILALAQKRASTEGSLPALATRANASKDGKLAAQTGDAYLSHADYAKAATLYQSALQKGGVVTDDVNTHLGMALALSGDKAGAKTAFAAVKGAPRSEIASFWSLWVDHPVVG